MTPERLSNGYTSIAEAKEGSTTNGTRSTREKVDAADGWRNEPALYQCACVADLWAHYRGGVMRADSGIVTFASGETKNTEVYGSSPCDQGTCSSELAGRDFGVAANGDAAYSTRSGASMNYRASPIPRSG